jgi:D-alanyl-D-alanine dipeptidase
VIYKAPKAFLRSPVAAALKKVQDSLAFYKAGLKIWDAYRPYAASIRFFEVYPDTNFVANPRYGSRHNRGCAVDLTLVERVSGKELPMPTPFDDFTPKAHPAYASLPDTVLSNRALLFGIMAHFGFTPIESEWWHFDYKDWKSYPLMDLTFEELDKTK